MTAQWNEIPTPTGKDALSRTYPAGYRTDVIDVPIQGHKGELEYMIRMKAGDTVVYSWEVLSISDPQSFYTEFHGHTETAPGRPGDLMFWNGHVAIVRDRDTLIHANAFHMAVAIEPIGQAVRRIRAAGSRLTSVRRIKHAIQ